MRGKPGVRRKLTPHHRRVTFYPGCFLKTFIRIITCYTYFYYFLFILFYYFQIFKLHIMFYCALLLSCNLHTVNTSVIYCNLRSGLSTLELKEYCIVLYCTCVFFVSRVLICLFLIRDSTTIVSPHLCYRHPVISFQPLNFICSQTLPFIDIWYLFGLNSWISGLVCSFIFLLKSVSSFSCSYSFLSSFFFYLRLLLFCKQHLFLYLLCFT